jgi:hypothetical protein
MLPHVLPKCAACHVTKDAIVSQACLVSPYSLSLCCICPVSLSFSLCPPSKYSQQKQHQTLQPRAPPAHNRMPPCHCQCRVYHTSVGFPGAIQLLLDVTCLSSLSSLSLSSLFLGGSARTPSRGLSPVSPLFTCAQPCLACSAICIYWLRLTTNDGQKLASNTLGLITQFLSHIALRSAMCDLTACYKQASLKRTWHVQQHLLKLFEDHKPAGVTP